MSAPESVGFANPGLITGTIVYGVIGLTLSVIAPMIFAKETPNITKVSLLIVYMLFTCAG
jgi:hypothetical protein